MPRRTAVLASTALLLASLAPTLPALAADPGPTVVLMQGDSVEANPFQIKGRSAAGAFLATPEDLLLVKAGGATSAQVRGNTEILAVADSRVVGYDPEAGTIRVAPVQSGTVGAWVATPYPPTNLSGALATAEHVAVWESIYDELGGWTNVYYGTIASDSTVAWSSPIKLPGGSTPMAILSDGFVYVTSSSDGGPAAQQPTRVSMPSGETTDLAPFAGDVGTAVLVPGAIIFSSQEWDLETNVTTARLVKIPVDGGDAVVLTSRASDCGYDFSRPVIAGDDLAFVVTDFCATSRSVERRALSDGALLSEIPATDAVAITETHTVTVQFAADDTTTLKATGRLGGDSVTIDVPRVTELAQGIGDEVLVRASGDAASSGLYTIQPSAGTASLLWGSGMRPASAELLALDEQRVAWTDNRSSPKGTWTRTLSRPGDGLAASSETLLEQNATSYGLAVSGAITAMYVQGADGPAVRITGAGSRTVDGMLRGLSDGQVLVTRQSFVGEDYLSSDILINAANGSEAEVPASSGGTRSRIAFDSGRILSADADGSVHLLDTSTMQEQLLQGPTPGEVASLDVTGTHAAWVRIVYDDETGSPASATLQLRDLASGVTRTLPASNAIRNVYLTDTWLLAAQDWLYGARLDDPASTLDKIADIPGADVRDVAGDVVGWIDAGFAPKVTRIPVLADGTGVVSAPSQPTAFSATAGVGSLTANWAAPANDGGGVITGYQLQHRPLGQTDWTTTSVDDPAATNKQISGLANGTSYEVRVAAINGAGTGTYASPATVTTPTAPGAPSAFALKRANKAFTATWVAPSDGGSSINGYVLRYRSSSSSSGPWGAWTTKTYAASARSATVTGLTNGRYYQVTVAATNAVGAGTKTTAKVVRPAGKPFAPTGLAATVTVGKTTFTWKAAAANGSPITGYRVQVSRNGTTWTTLTSTNTTRTFAWRNGTKRVAYYVRVAAKNSVGWGTYSSRVKFTFR